MSFSEKIAGVAERAAQMSARLETEEATKNALVMPFIAALGYDVFDPDEVVPEFTADVGLKKGEKVDYAIKRGDDIIMLFECKRASTNLAEAEMSQLYRYFAVTAARIGVLTNGVRYRLYSDLDEPNKMDERPFLEFDIRALREATVDELRKLTKDGFDLEEMIDAASDLKNLGQIRAILAAQYEEPDEDFVRYFFAATNPGRQFRSTVKDQFAGLVRKALHQFVNDRVSDRLRSALERESEAKQRAAEEIESELEDEESEIVTTEEELEAFRIVRAITCSVLPTERVVYRDRKSYMAVLADDNNRKPICRFWFNTAQKYLGLFDDGKAETRHKIERPMDIYRFAAELKRAAARYVDSEAATTSALDGE